MPEKKETDSNEVQDNQEKSGKNPDQNVPEDAQLKTDSEVEKDKKKIEQNQAEIKEDKEEKKDKEEKIETAGETAPQGEGKVEEETVTSKSVWNGDLNRYSEIRKDLPEIKPGDVVRVSYRVIEGGKERIQVFEGIVIAIKNPGISRTITVRKTSFGIAVERVFPLNSRLLQKIVVKKHSKVRRAKLYYLRKLRGKAARLKELR